MQVLKATDKEALSMLDNFEDERKVLGRCQFTAGVCTMEVP